MNSINFYNKQANSYIDKTSKLDLTAHYKTFEEYLTPPHHILDLGCGSGRDSLYFNNKGYQVSSLDGSLEMVNHCKIILTSPVYHGTFEDFTTNDKYDAIWASASLLHVYRHDMVKVLKKFISYLEVGGIFYASFKKYKEDFDIDGRHFTCFTENSLSELVKLLENIEVISIKESDSIQENNMQWVNVLLKRI